MNLLKFDRTPTLSNKVFTGWLLMGLALVYFTINNSLSHIFLALWLLSLVVVFRPDVIRAMFNVGEPSPEMSSEEADKLLEATRITDLVISQDSHKYTAIERAELIQVNFLALQKNEVTND